MTTLLNTATRSGFLQRFPAMFNGGRIDIYSGTQPDSSDDAPTGVLLAQVVADSGLRFISAGTWIGKAPEQEWVINGLAVGTAGWFRLVGPQSHAPPCIDGACYPLADPRAGLILPSLSISPLSERPVSNFVFTL